MSSFTGFEGIAALGAFATAISGCRGFCPTRLGRMSAFSGFLFAELAAFVGAAPFFGPAFEDAGFFAADAFLGFGADFFAAFLGADFFGAFGADFFPATLPEAFLEPAFAFVFLAAMRPISAPPRLARVADRPRFSGPCVRNRPAKA